MGEHLTADGKFKSDKFPWCPEGYVALNVTSSKAWPALRQLAETYYPTDPVFANDLWQATHNAEWSGSNDTIGRTFPPVLPSCPPHYAVGGVEAIDIIRAKLTPKEFEGHCRACVLKYLFRYPDKGGVKDLDKAIQYLSWLRDCVRSQQRD